MYDYNVTCDVDFYIIKYFYSFLILCEFLYPLLPSNSICIIIVHVYTDSIMFYFYTRLRTTTLSQEFFLKTN